MLTHISFLVIRTSTYTHFDLWEKKTFQYNFDLWEKKTFQCYNYLGKKEFFGYFGIWEKKTMHLGKKDIPKNASGKKRHCKKGIWEKKIMHIFVGIWEKKIFIWEKKLNHFGVLTKN